MHQHHIHEDKNIQINNAEWTVKRISLLNKLWANGVSISAIAKELGLSRNAVAGKAHRLKLPKRNRVYEQSNAWDEEKQERLIKLRKYGLSAARISEIIEVSEDLIRKKIELL
ncbi:GcrA family cell cycle regulator [Alphaproteobacteria bacterium]|nr:GcrA family cell cycle regulator [Alphaproteobacteria bacterium]